MATVTVTEQEAPKPSQNEERNEIEEIQESQKNPKIHNQGKHNQGNHNQKPQDGKASPTEAKEKVEPNDASEEVSEPPPISLPRLCLVLGFIWTSVAFIIIDESMIATLLAPISTSFNAFSNLSWIATTFLIGQSAAQPLTGHLTEIFGRRNGLTCVSVIFLIGTLICGLSDELWMLLLGRSIQGFGGGAIDSIASFIEADLVPLRNRGVTEGLAGIVFGVSLSIGGPFGGGINDAIGWKWAFLIQVPLVFICTVATWFLVQIPRKKSDISGWRRIDYVGGITVLASLLLIQLGLNSGSTSKWDSPIVFAPLPTGAVLFGAFLYWEGYFAKEPLIPLKLFRVRNVLFSSLYNFFGVCSYFSVQFYVPIYLQVMGLSTAQTGLRFIPQAGAAAITLLAVGFIVKITGRYYILNIFAQVFNLLGSGLLVTLNTSSPSWKPFLYLAFTGVGFGASWVTILMGTLSAINDDQQATVQGTAYCVRAIGTTIGLTASTAVFQSILKINLQEVLGNTPEGPELINILKTDFSAVQTLDSAVKLGVQEAYMKALHGVYYLCTAECIVAAISSFLMKEYKITEA